MQHNCTYYSTVFLPPLYNAHSKTGLTNRELKLEIIFVQFKVSTYMLLQVLTSVRFLRTLSRSAHTKILVAQAKGPSRSPLGNIFFVFVRNFRCYVVRHSFLF